MPNGMEAEIPIEQLIAQAQVPQQQDPGIVQMLAQLLQPGEAEAAGAPDPWTRKFRELQMRNQQIQQQRQMELQQQRMQQQAEQQQQQMQLRERQMQLSERKQASKERPGGDITGQLTQILGGGQPSTQGQPDLIFSGETPGTGTPYFSDKPLPFAPPEIQQAQQARIDARKAKPTAAAPAEGGLSTADIAKSAELSKLLKSQGYPAETINMVLQATFPGISEPKRKAAAGEKESNYIRTHAKDFFNKETGQPLGASDVLSEGFDPKEIRKTHMELNTEQKKNSEGIASVDQQIEAYRFLKDNLDRTSTPGYVNTAKNWMTTQGQRFRGDPKYASLAAARTQITQLARAFGGDSRVSDKEMQLLQGAIISDSDNKEAIEAKLKILEDFRKSKAKQVGLPWLQKQAEAQTEGGKSKLASKQDIANAMRQSKGNRKQALELLRNQGFTGAQ